MTHEIPALSIMEKRHTDGSRSRMCTDRTPNRADWRLFCLSDPEICAVRNILPEQWVVEPRCSLTYTAWKNRYRFYFSLPGSGCYFRFSILWPFLRSQPHLFQWRWQAWWIKYFPPRRQSLRCVRPVLNTQGYQRRLRHRHLSFSLRVFRRFLSRKVLIAQFYGIKDKDLFAQTYI